MFWLFEMRVAAGQFRRDEIGEVTIAWVLITAAGVALAIAVLSSVGGGSQELSESIDTELSDREIPTSY